MASRQLYPVASLEARTTPAFRAALLDLALRRGLDPTALAVVMFLESGFDPAVRNATSGATGLIQFMPSTARLLGTTTAQLARLSAVAQLAWVDRYYARFGRGIARPEDHYLACFLPKYIGAADNTEIARSGSPVYDQNTGLDATRDGVLTVGDVVARFRQVYAAARAREPLAEARVDLLGTAIVFGGLAGLAALAWSVFRP